MTELLDIIVFDTASFWLLLVLTVAVIISIPTLFGIRLLNALLPAQLTLILNAIPIISGLSNDSLSVERVTHFFAIEISYLTLIYVVYAQLILHRVSIRLALSQFFNSKYVLMLMIAMGLIVILNFLAVPSDGSSRIEYMTAGWYTAVRPLISFASPLAYIGVFILMQNSRRRGLAFVFLVLVILENILALSKAGFLFGLIFAVLTLRDLSGEGQTLIRNRDKYKLWILVGAMVFVALTRLDISAQAFVQRIFLTSDATLMTYFSAKPTTPCEGVSTFAKMHRGFARFAGDPSANDINTLFGYALMIEATGENSFTGPNSRLSPYALCNFPDESIFLLIICIFIYLGLFLAIFQRILRRPILLAIMYPYILASLYSGSQDFNLIMQGITFFLLLLVITIIFSQKTRQKIG